MRFGLSQALVRKEDEAFLRGDGRYVADLVPPDACRAVVLRSPHAHARLASLDAEAARAMPGVRLILTADDVADLGGLPCVGVPPGVSLEAPENPILVREKAFHVGDAVAFVVADTIDQGKDAAEAIAVAWESVPHVVGAVEALKPEAPQLRATHPGNLAFEMTIGDEARTAAAFAGAAHTVSLTLVNQRLVANYLDTRAVLADYDPASDSYTLTAGSQGVHLLQTVLAGRVLRIPQEKLRVITPDVGGGFGTKIFPYREYALAAVAAKRIGRPVAWVADRIEHFLADSQGRDNVTTARLALDEKGKFLALDVETVCDMGAYLSHFAPFIPYVGANMLPGVYDIPVCCIRLRGAFTNTVPVDAYRGAGRPEAAYVIERLVDTAARDLGIAPDMLRKRNFIKPKAMPYRTATGKVYDTGDFAGHMARAQDIGDWRGFNKRAAASKRKGRLRGIGLATYIEACGAVGPETAKLTLDREGIVTIHIGSQSTGQGHHTSYAQLVADHLHLPPHHVRVVQGDTALIASGAGTGGSSSIPCGGVAVSGAAKKLADNLKRVAAEALEAGVGDLEIADAGVRVVGTDRALSFADLARTPHAKPDHLKTEHKHSPEAPTFPNGTHLAEVEIDAETGRAEIVSYVVVDDFGVTLNPLLLVGQVVGGAVQGIGQALMERTVYDRESGQLVTASLLDYALPRAEDTPDFAFETRNVPCATNPLGVKGAGEAGTIGACPAVMNAIVDALWRAYRIRHIDMPATPEDLWAAIEEGKRLHTL